jgi:hypothetical protein
MICKICNLKQSTFNSSICDKCEERAARPETVFLDWYRTIGVNFDLMYPGLADGIVTFKNGRYVTYREWARLKYDSEDRLQL